jgi:hypothetical protein
VLYEVDRQSDNLVSFPFKLSDDVAAGNLIARPSVSAELDAGRVATEGMPLGIQIFALLF